MDNQLGMLMGSSSTSLNMSVIIFFLQISKPQLFPPLLFLLNHNRQIAWRSGGKYTTPGIPKNFLPWEQKWSLYLTTSEAVKNALWLDNRVEKCGKCRLLLYQIWKYCYVWCLNHHLEILTAMKSNHKAPQQKLGPCAPTETLQQQKQCY